MRFRELVHRYRFPAEAQPAWAERVERWYALDAQAFGLADAAARWRELARRPGILLLASPGASNESDWRFARSGATSPAKFVHTLPSVRASALCLVLEWNGPMLCLQSDPVTVESALEEARLFSDLGTIWVAGVRRVEPGVYEAYLWEGSTDG